MQNQADINPRNAKQNIKQGNAKQNIKQGNAIQNIKPDNPSPDNIKGLTVCKRLKIMNMRGGTAKNM